ncbi:hypothetical protein HanXRQr2_Chr13g0585701 [Helianthus annuus]|uniref:Uncharacterized protein n=1 Tax=Helianthus annuus TaxID=4232 RepID=A0A9K3H9Z5_HELAN|nr:hypothetical protein HanXRQr2_Chr13g0585701 [Helianthus annuus]KAJ0848995.1 hypothetical protein HanPSC8_Chr13g0563871 [Helianthus annuus]
MRESKSVCTWTSAKTIPEKVRRLHSDLYSSFHARMIHQPHSQIGHPPSHRTSKFKLRMH